MKSRSIILMLLIVLLPLVLLTWAAIRIGRQEQTLVQDRFREVMETRLDDINREIRNHFDQTQRELQSLNEVDHLDVERMRELVRTQPKIMQLFVVSEKGKLLFPDPTGPLNRDEERFLQSTARMFTGQELLDAVLQTVEASEPLTRSSNSRMRALPKTPEQSIKETSGWFTWYWDRGLNLVYWQRRSSGKIVGVALERSRWIADIIAKLPNTDDILSSDIESGGLKQSSRSEKQIETRFRLLDASGETIYQWGNYDVPIAAKPYCEISVAAPLQSWRLQCLLPENQISITGRSAWLGLLGGLGAVAVAIAAMAWVFYRDYSLSMREAAEQVSFVNQVSHELKTPLTNIRLYAELLESDLANMPEEDADKPRRRLNVILSEGQRLTRLIGNVLTFARQQRKSLQPQGQTLIPDEVISQIVDRFRPPLEALGIATELNLNAKQPMSLDPDFVEQILGNLINNVEKYAAEGKLLRLTSQQTESELSFSVIDAGPGIPADKQQEVFRPFSRLSQKIRCATGTGIGLSIARELARMHGGDIQLNRHPRSSNTSEYGCEFVVAIKGLQSLEHRVT